MTDGTRKLIASVLADNDSDVRRQAAEALASDSSLAVVAALAAGLQDESKGVRDAVSRSLCALGGINVARAIVEYIGNENIVTRNLASELLVKLGETSIPALLPYLQHTSQDVRKFAVDILGLIGSTAPTQAMLPLLQDPDNNVVVSLVEALGNMHASGALQALYETYDRNPYAKPDVAEALGKIADPSAGNFLLLRLQEELGAEEKDPVTLFTMIEALATLGTDRAFTVLMQNLPRVTGRLRSAILSTLVQIAKRTSRALEFAKELRGDFLVALRDPDASFRMSAAEVLVLQPGADVSGALLGALGSSPELDAFLMHHLPDREDALAASVKFLEAHRQLQAKQVVHLMGRLAFDLTRAIMHGRYDDEEERRCQRAFILVADRWAGADEETRAAIVDVLFRLDGDGAVEFLDAIMNDPDPWLRMHVIEIIAAISDPRAPEFITRFLDDDDEMVREVAMNTLLSRGYIIDTPEQAS